MQMPYNALLMRIYVSQSHQFEGKPLYHALLEAMLAAGLAGATAFLGAEGLGQHRRFSADMAVDAPGDLPILIEVVESEDRLRSFLPRLEALFTDGLVTLERLAVTRYERAEEPG